MHICAEIQEVKSSQVKSSIL